MDDDVKTHIQDFMIETMNVDESKVEDYAELLNNYLDERGYTIIDKYFHISHNLKIELI